MFPTLKNFLENKDLQFSSIKLVEKRHLEELNKHFDEYFPELKEKKMMTGFAILSRLTVKNRIQAQTKKKNLLNCHVMINTSFYSSQQI
jgi:hypothetical protein